ncbi:MULTISPECIES: PAS domain-containing protein [unclassified Methylobacterium]|uniref:PAS domain-containing protein n=1 Tax=unclassified Methylobacterium TaxID=2615210 RepID=UPI0036F88DE7
MIWVSDEKGQLLYVHSGWQVLTGQSPAETLGNGWIAVVHPDDRDLIVGGFAEACRRRIEFLLRYRIRRSDGSYAWILGAASPSFTPLTHDFLGFLGLVSQYEDGVPNLTAKVEIGSLKPGQEPEGAAPQSKLDIAADHLIAARAVTEGCGEEVAASIDRALRAVGQALSRARTETESPNRFH